MGNEVGARYCSVYHVPMEPPVRGGGAMARGSWWSGRRAPFGMWRGLLARTIRPQNRIRAVFRPRAPQAQHHLLAAVEMLGTQIVPSHCFKRCYEARRHRTIRRLRRLSQSARFL